MNSEQSILKTIRRLVGIDAEFTQFDPELISAINAAFMTLHQLGLGPANGFMIDGEDQTWGDFTNDITQLAGLVNYVLLRTRLVFDPPTNSFVVTSMENQIKELEFRFNVNAEGAFHE
mgnify:FL=1